MSGHATKRRVSLKLKRRDREKVVSVSQVLVLVFRGIDACSRLLQFFVGDFSDIDMWN